MKSEYIYLMMSFVLNERLNLKKVFYEKDIHVSIVSYTNKCS